MDQYKRMFVKIVKNICVFAGMNFIGVYCYIQWKKKLSSEKFNIVFDLDETIIHTNKLSKLMDFNKSNMLAPTDTLGPNINPISKHDSVSRIVWVRPWVRILLPIISEFNNVYLFTRATKPYADEIIIKTNLEQYFKEKKYRNECDEKCKDLKKFNINLNKSFLVDDKLSNKCEKQKLYHIPRFNSYVKNDCEFIKLFGWILWINILDDVQLLKSHIKKN